jgi:hypothetical protein
MGQFGIVLEFVLKAYPALRPINAGTLVTTGDHFEQVSNALKVISTHLNLLKKLKIHIGNLVDVRGA